MGAGNAVAVLVAGLTLGGAPAPAVAQETLAPAPPLADASPADPMPAPATLPKAGGFAPEVKQAFEDSPPSRHFRIRTSDYGALAVQSRDVQTFYYIRQDNYQDLASTDGDRVARLTALRAFGPNPTNSRFAVRYGENYVFLPVCAGKLDARRIQLGRALRGERDVSVRLSCR